MWAKAKSDTQVRTPWRAHAWRTALAIAIFGPKRFQHQIVKPVQNAVGDQASQLWADSRPLREQIGTLFARAGSDRDRLVKNFQSWVGHFRAT